jgi:hypothetical protein
MCVSNGDGSMSRQLPNTFGTTPISISPDGIWALYKTVPVFGNGGGGGPNDKRLNSTVIIPGTTFTTFRLYNIRSGMMRQVVIPSTSPLSGTPSITMMINDDGQIHILYALETEAVLSSVSLETALAASFEIRTITNDDPRLTTEQMSYQTISLTQSILDASGMTCTDLRFPSGGVFYDVSRTGSMVFAASCQRPPAECAATGQCAAYLRVVRTSSGLIQSVTPIPDEDYSYTQGSFAVGRWSPHSDTPSLAYLLNQSVQVEAPGSTVTTTVPLPTGFQSRWFTWSFDPAEAYIDIECAGLSERLLFVGGDGENSEVYAAQNGDCEQITSSSAAVADPDIASNGAIVFVHETARGNTDLVVRQPNGAETVITETMGRETNPVWSPDGMRIAYEYTVNQNTTLRMINADGTDSHTVSPYAASYPTWSPDGQWLMYVRNTPDMPDYPRDQNLAYVQATCREPHSGCTDALLTDLDRFRFSHLDWIPGRLLVVVNGRSSDQLYEAIVTGTTPTIGTTTLITQAPFIASPSYNASGNAFVAETLRSGDPTEVIERWTRPNISAAWVSPLSANNTRIGPILYGGGPSIVLIEGSGGLPISISSTMTAINGNPIVANELPIPYADTVNVTISITNVLSQSIDNWEFEIFGIATAGQSPSYGTPPTYADILALEHAADVPGSVFGNNRIRWVGGSLASGQSIPLQAALHARRSGMITTNYQFTYFVNGQSNVVMGSNLHVMSARLTNVDFAGEDANVKAAIFWAIFNETSEGNLVLHNPNALPCTQSGWQTNASGLPFTEILHIVHEASSSDPRCQDLVYLETQTILNGIIRYERLSAQLHTYFTENYAGSLGNNPPEDRTDIFYVGDGPIDPDFGSNVLWMSKQCWPLENSLRITDSVTPVSYRVVLESVLYNDFRQQAVLSWLEQYLACFMMSNGGASSARGEHQRAFFERVYNSPNAIIDSVIDDFVTRCESRQSSINATLSCDPSFGAVGLVKANYPDDEPGSDLTIVYSEDVENCSGETPVTVLSSSSIDFITPLEAHLRVIGMPSLNGGNVPAERYRPSYSSVLQPVVFLHRNLSINGNYSIVGCQWISVVHVRAQSPYNYPR